DNPWGAPFVENWEGQMGSGDAGSSRASAARDAESDRFGNLDAVDRGGQDAPGVTCTLPGGEQPRGVEALEVLAARDPDWRGGARLDSGHQRVGVIVIGDLA